MKKILMTLVLMPQMVLARTEVVNGITWTYTIIDDKAQVGNGLSSAIPSSTSGAIMIPTTLGDRQVTSIGDYAFSGCSGLTSVTIQSSVTSIEMCRFPIPCGRVVREWCAEYATGEILL